MQKLILFCLFFLSLIKGYSQITINGATCVLQGTQYQYDIIAGQDSSTTVQVCITGGVLTGTNDSCVTSAGIFQAQVSWNASITNNGTITVTIGSNTQTLNVSVSPQLSGGTIDTSIKNQFVDSTTIPATIACSAAVGGACSPSYTYQWQSSDDNLSWANIDSATSQNITFAAPLLQSGYYRRVTTEGVSKSIAYSDVAAVFITAPGIAYRLQRRNEYSICMGLLPTQQKRNRKNA